MIPLPPGAAQPSLELWGPFADRHPSLPDTTLILADARVLRLHPEVHKAILPRGPLVLRAGERTKGFPTLASVLARGAPLPRSATLLALGGGTIGDLATVAAHLLKRGVRLIHVPTTLLAAVDSSIGGKGAVHVRGVKNGAGVFHNPVETWVCPEFFGSLPIKQQREGQVEAWKMAVCLDAPLWDRWRADPPALLDFVRDARRLKTRICAEDPYETQGLRAILNFGHTFGHAFESLTRFRLSHGDAVRLGILCALDVGVSLGLTPPSLRNTVEQVIAPGGRLALIRLLANVQPERLSSYLAADKKNTGPDALRMVLLESPGAARVHAVEPATWLALWPRWQTGST